MDIQNALAAADEAYLVGMSNKGTYKRACKDAEAADVSVTYGEDAAEVSIGGETCTVKNPLWESTCSCPSRSVCRHLIAAMIWLRTHGEQEEADEELPPDVPAALPDALRETLGSVTFAELQRAMGSRVSDYVKQLGEITLEESSILAGTLPDGTAVRLLYPLEGSTCACHKKELCAHKAAVILAWQAKEGIAHPEEFLQKASIVPDEEAARIRESAASSYALLSDVLRWGLVRLPENLTEHLEAAAVQSHALNMADAEQMLRSVGSTLEENRNRRAIFRTELLVSRICRTARYLEKLQSETLTEEMLGQFRGSYEQQKNDLTILPIGQREVRGGDYEGMVYYFLNLDESAEQRFLTVSDLRPAFYDSVNLKRVPKVMPWGTGQPVSTLMRSKMILHNAKISDGKLSTSQETAVVDRAKANLDCDEIRNLICTDFRQIAVKLAERPPVKETDRLCFVHPEKCLSSGFDAHAQQFRMAIADAADNVVEIRVRYQAEQKKFIEQLESIGKAMLKAPEKPYVWLCTAHFEEGRLTLFPIEVYDFIRVPEMPEYCPPAHLERRENAYAPAVLSLTEEAEHLVCTLLQSGLQAARSAGFSELSRKAADCGMQGFSELLQALADRMERFRHAAGDTAPEVLHALTEVQQYMTICRDKLEVLCALAAMR